MANKSVIFIIQHLSGGGAERVVSILASKLAEMGIDVSVLLYFPVDHEYEMNTYVKKIYLTRSSTEYFSMNQLQKIKRVREVIKNKYDFLIPFSHFTGIHIQIAALGMPSKVIQTIRNDPRNHPESRIVRMLRDLCFLLMWRGFVQNERQLSYFGKTIRKKTVVLPNPVTSSLLEIKRVEGRMHTIIAVGRLHEQKNYSMLIKSVALLKKQGYHFVVKIYGEGPQKRLIESLIVENEVEDSCFLCGRSNDMKTTYQDADLFVMTSNYEGMPNALMEAMASGLPCISTDCPTGPAELIKNGENGLLIPMDDAKTCANQIRFLLDNPATAYRMGQQARNAIWLRHNDEYICNRFVDEVLMLTEY